MFTTEIEVHNEAQSMNEIVYFLKWEDGTRNFLFLLFWDYRKIDWKRYIDYPAGAYVFIEISGFKK